MILFYFSKMPLWLDLVKPWNDDKWISLNENDFKNSTIKDLRSQSQDWKNEMNNDLQNSQGCVKLLPSGIIDISYNESCSEEAPALCSYRSCLTTDGEACIFPFKHKNVTMEGLETEQLYTKCATVDLFVPWCPTGKNYINTIWRIIICSLF